MTACRALPFAAALLLAACHRLGQSVTPTVTYTCSDGRQVQAAYPDRDSAVLVLDGRSHRLRQAISADGARYVGDGWQWWAKGLRQATLAPLKSGETIASARGMDCRAR
ncbi:MliC family protein [Fulvimonas sp. R45]|uniref:MliC family protein n=1 Tax=Fulvimonas sp. R45 TaxID=3045937 RepID=UPI0026604D41|nr:MliC family protein [Fulvimonas sp. R45]MDO1528313.1 MliC family protein [Fulvimonas sp. R45]